MSALKVFENNGIQISGIRRSASNQFNKMVYKNEIASVSGPKCFCSAGFEEIISATKRTTEKRDRYKKSLWAKFRRRVPSSGKSFIWSEG